MTSVKQEVFKNGGGVCVCVCLCVCVCVWGCVALFPIFEILYLLWTTKLPILKVIFHKPPM